MTRALARALPAALALSQLSACCWFWRPSGPETETLVVVVPSRHDGHVGSVVVNQGERHEVLDTAYATAKVDGHGEVHREPLKAEDIDKLFGRASAALPRKAVSFTLYFVLAKQVLTDESQAKLNDVLTTAAGWEAAEITVIGHTDRMGTDEDNDALSLKRAEAVRQMLIDKGANAASVHAVGMGERDPIVPTEDGVEEAANRRVEVMIR